jgi:hypothetical protein
MKTQDPISWTLEAVTGFLGFVLAILATASLVTLENSTAESLALALAGVCGAWYAARLCGQIFDL